MSSVFDFFGIVVFYVIKGKLIIQEFWRCWVDWDDELFDDIFQKW